MLTLRHVMLRYMRVENRHYVTINCSTPSLTWHSEVSATTHTISSQKWSSSIARLFLSRLITHRPPLRFLGSSHIGWMPSCSVTTQTLNIYSRAQLSGCTRKKNEIFHYWNSPQQQLESPKYLILTCIITHVSNYTVSQKKHPRRFEL